MSGGSERIARKPLGPEDATMTMGAGKLSLTSHLEAPDGTPLLPDPFWSGTIKYRGRDGEIHETTYHDGTPVGGYGAPSGGGGGPSCCSCGG